MTQPTAAPDRPVDPKWSRRFSGVIVSVLGIVFCFAAFFISRHIEERRIGIEFQLLAERNAAQLRNGVDRFCDIPKLLRLYFQNSEFVSRGEFHDLGTNLLNESLAIQAVQWVNIVPGAERSAFEQKCVAEGLADFQIRDLQPNGGFRPADPASEYWAITYCEPLEGNQAVIGYNLLSGPTAPILRRAAESGKTLGTQTFPLAQLNNPLGWILLAPIFGGSTNASTATTTHRGFVQVVLRVESMLESIIEDDPEKSTEWIIQDVSEGAKDRLLYSRRTEKGGPGRTDVQNLRSSDFMVERSFTVLGRTWRMRFSPSPSWLDRQRTFFPFVILLLGLCITGALQLHVVSLRRRTAQVEREVSEKTARLSESNRLLVAEASARQKVQDHLELVLRGADLGTWESDLVTGSLSFSDRLATMLGFDPSEPESTRAWWQSRIHPEDLENSLESVENHLAGRSHQIEVIQRVQKRDDSYIWVIDLSSVVERDASGKPVRVAGTRGDIHERTLADVRALRLATAVDQATESIVLLDAQGRVEFTNRAFAKRMGCAESALLGRSFDAVWPAGPGDESLNFAVIAAEIARSGVWRGNLRDLRRGDQICSEQLIVSAVTDSKEQPLGFVVVARDITRESGLEEQVRQSQKMEAVGLLAGGVAHDFNNLLQIVRGYAALAAESDTLAEQQSHLGLVLDAVDRASELTRQLLAFGRGQALQRTVIDLNVMTREMLRMIRRIIPENIEISPYIASDSIRIRGDHGQIEQILLNLCVNARDAMPNGGRLVIRLDVGDVDKAAAARHESVKPRRYARLRVSDTGTGMDPATLARIFEPFFSTKPKDRGTGLGLSVVYGIVRQHEGFVDVMSQPNKGTTFSIHFPITGDQEVPEPPALAPTPIQHGDGTVLLVEDEPLVRSLAVRVLKRAGYDVITAEDGQEACETFAKDPDVIDIVVMDMIMPRMGGREAYHRINVIKPGVPVLFCSGYSHDGKGGTFDLPPGTSLLAKPYLPSEFTALIARLIQDSRIRAASV
jgi:PAS domain S-box-containing protein